MVLHANKSSVKLNITELAEFIANELEVNVSQVLMNLELTFHHSCYLLSTPTAPLLVLGPLQIFFRDNLVKGNN